MAVTRQRPSDHFASRRRAVRTAASAILAGSVVITLAGATGTAGRTQWAGLLPGEAADADGGLVVSEVMTGGASASDEFVEIYNPTTAELPLEGLELIYVTASGATVTRKADWPAGSPGVAPGAHLLVANEAGVFAAIADATYAGGLAATGGSVALRIQGASSAVDAVGWGTAVNTWMEGSPAAAVAAGHSLERLPGGQAGSGQDTDQNSADFFDQSVPDPQNAASDPIPVSPSPVPSASQGPTDSPAATPSPSPTPTSTHTASPIPTPTTSPPPNLVTIATARALPDGATATIEGVSLTDGAFTDGGGHLVDGSAGIAVLVSGGTFPRGHLVRVTGELDDRYHQRTLRAAASAVVVIGPAPEPDGLPSGTGAIGEELESELVLVSAEIVSSATQLSGAVAYEIDDGSGPARLLVPDSAAIDQSGWQRGTILDARGVVGQRDSSGTGTTGYRVQLRDQADVLAVAQPSPSASPSVTSSPGGTPSPAPSDDPSVVSIATARRAAPNARLRVRGVVTLPSSVLGEGTAAIQDGSGAIILRIGDEAGELALGELVQVDGVRSTMSGMETLRVSVAPLRLGSQAQPDAERHPTGALGEAQEALLVTVRGAVATAPRRTSAQNVYFDLDDGSGPLRVYLTPGSTIPATELALGAWVEITGVLGQETSGQQPLRGHRLWPRMPADVRVVSPAAPGGADGSDTEGAGGNAGSGGNGGSALQPAGVMGRSAAAGRWPSELPEPRLSASRAAAAAVPTPSPEPASASAGGRREGRDPTLAALLALGAAALGAGGAAAARRPGMIERLRAALHGGASPTEPGEEPASGAAEGAPGPGSALERTVAHLVPLAVVDDDLSERTSSTSSRSRVRRILPPT